LVFSFTLRILFNLTIKKDARVLVLGKDYSPLINNIGTNPRIYESGIQKIEKECRQQHTGNSVAYRKWFTGKPKTIQRSGQNLRQYCEWLNKTPEQLIEEYREFTQKR
jgi:hypothetical protein